MTTENFKIIKSEMGMYHTEYLIEYKGKIFTCIHNGGLPKLHNQYLNEKLRCELSDLLEDYFLAQVVK